MAKITDGTFRTWHDTETIDAAEYVRERELLRVSVNDNDERLGNLEESASGLLLGTVQLAKITDDTGGVKISIEDTAGDILAALKEAGKGFHTFYAVSGSKNLPTSKSVRGHAHITSVNPSFGYVMAMDYNGTTSVNYIDNDVWIGWQQLVSNKDTQDELWGGVMYPTENQNITPTKKLSDCRTGWLLVWSDMDAGIGPNNFNWSTTFVPKTFTEWGGTNFMAAVPSYIASNGLTSITVVKQLSITNTTITGNTTNDEGDVNDVVLRKVLEV